MTNFNQICREEKSKFEFVNEGFFNLKYVWYIR